MQITWFQLTTETTKLFFGFAMNMFVQKWNMRACCLEIYLLSWFCTWSWRSSKWGLLKLSYNQYSLQFG